jgi:hypothetical protein
MCLPGHFHAPMIRLRMKLGGLDRLKEKLSERNSPMMRDIRDSWRILFRSFIRLRFVRASRGDGTWTPLAPSTIRRRRRGRGRGTPRILVDSGKLQQGLSPGGDTFFENDTPAGFEAILAGSPLSTLAMWHHEGNERLPSRTILVPPPAKEVEKMGKAAAKIIAEYGNE